MQPLHSVRVVSLAVNIPGPVAAATLRELGAAVIKVEPPGGDPLATVSPDWYNELISGIRVVALDLKTSAARARLDELLAPADLLLTSTRPAALERLGLAWSALHARHPRLSQVAIVGYPAPRQNVPGHDLTYQAATGLVAPPALPRTLLADLGGAQRTVIAALATLMACDRDGSGAYVEVSLSAAARFFAEPLLRGLTAEGGPLGGQSPVYNLYRARDGWLALAALEPRFREALQRELPFGEHDVADDRAGHRHALSCAFGERSAAEWQAWGEARDLPVVAVRTIAPDSLR
jgi:crotonobetainyl-CoA:carnitine CoA-transferase CaiB-like acyl-CoA transferase